MSIAINNLQAAMIQAIANSPAVGGFSYLAETLRLAGVVRNEWVLPSCQSLYLTSHGPVVMQGNSLVNGFAEISVFDPELLIHAIREDQAGMSTFPEFLMAIWKAGVIRYVVDFNLREVGYMGCNGESYSESYQHVSVD